MTGKPNGSMQRSDTPAADGATPAISPAEVEGLRALLAERGQLVQEQAETIRDLRTRLDSEAEERRRLMALLTGPTYQVKYEKAADCLTKDRDALLAFYD